MYLSDTRNVELSLMDYLKINLATDWHGVTVIKTFKDAYSTTVNLPIVCVRLADTASTRLEIGNTVIDDRHLLIIDIFTRSDAQRLDLSAYIMSKITAGWIHYDYSRSSGDTTGDLLSVAAGTDFVTDFISNSRVDFFQTVDDKDKYRQSISVRVRKSS